jgi:hypothetical protein
MRSALVHGNRIAAYLVFRQLRLEGLEARNGHRIEDVYGRVDQLTPSVADQLVGVLNRDFSDSYLSVLFKNTPRCRDLVQKVIGTRQDNPPERTLFS